MIHTLHWSASPLLFPSYLGTAWRMPFILRRMTDSSVAIMSKYFLYLTCLFDKSSLCGAEWDWVILNEDCGAIQFSLLSAPKGTRAALVLQIHVSSRAFFGVMIVSLCGHGSSEFKFTQSYNEGLFFLLDFFCCCCWTDNTLMFFSYNFQCTKSLHFNICNAAICKLSVCR